MAEKQEIQEQVALVTGASRGIGAAIARALAHIVALNGRDRPSQKPNKWQLRNLSAPAVFMCLYYLRALYRICRNPRHFCPYFHLTLLISFLSILHVGC